MIENLKLYFKNNWEVPHNLFDGRSVEIEGYIIELIVDTPTQKVYSFEKDFEEIFIAFEGYSDEASYGGESYELEYEYEGYRQVTKKVKSIETWENV